MLRGAREADRARTVCFGVVGLASLVLSFLGWWVVASLMRPGTIPLDRVALMVGIVAAAVSALGVAVWLAAIRPRTWWAVAVPAVALVSVVVMSAFASGGWLAVVPSIAFFGPVFFAWAFLWRVSWILASRAESRDRRTARVEHAGK